MSNVWREREKGSKMSELSTVDMYMATMTCVR
jgi:hypothetical protein